MNIFSSVRSIYSALGAMLFLIALYLILERGTSASTIMNSIGTNASSVFKTLQGRG